MSSGTAANSEPACGSIGATRESLCHRDSSVTDYIQSVLAAIRAVDPGISAFACVAGADALREAAAADEVIRKLGPAAWHQRPLLGLAISVKDLIQTRDLPTGRGSLLQNRRARVDAPVVARLRAAGGIVVGKTTTSEHGWSASTVNRVTAPTRNPWAPDRTAGGSSGGAAAAVSAGLCTAALGTDGAGSVRIPAAFCGVVGFKPSLGRIPYVPPCADRLAHLGPLARSVPDIIELTELLTGPHLDDPDSAIGPVDPAREPASLRIGWIEFPGTSPEVRRVSEQVWPVLTGLGHRVECMDVPFADPYSALVDIIAATEATGTAPDDEEWCDPGRVVIARYGRTVSGAAVMRAEEVRLALRSALRAVMDRYDLLAMATVPIEPFDAGAIAPRWAADPADLLWLAWSPATYPFNMTGQPAVSLPVGASSAGLPVGLQLVGPLGADRLVLSTARRIEAAIGTAPLAPARGMRGQ
jgi:aspartyl-tRNA(Asn)/glutamyl-tRNA(Gln) amidotransferase subunit A